MKGFTQSRALQGLRVGTKDLARKVLPQSVVDVAKRVRRAQGYIPAVGDVRFGDLRRLEPVSRCYGFDRGLPIDRYYIEQFLARESPSIHGRVLEIGERTYTDRFGSKVEQSDVLHVCQGCEEATYVDDLTEGATLPSGAFDCVILTQTLHLIFDMKAALATVARILKPGGTLLATVPGITQISDSDWNDTWYWALSAVAAKRLCAAVFPAELVQVESHGNVLAATSFLQGLADSELTRAELDFHDPEYPVTVTIKARRGAAESQATSPTGKGNGAAR